MPHRAVDDGTRVVPREDWAKHVERTDIRRGLAASVRVRGEDEVYERLPQHGDDYYTKSPSKTGKDSCKKKRKCLTSGETFWRRG